MDYARFDYPENGTSFDKEQNQVLEVGRVYELESVNMGQSYTYIFLKGLRYAFNSVNFSFWTDNNGKLERFHLQEREEYNPYYHIFGWDKGRKAFDDDELY